MSDSQTTPATTPDTTPVTTTATTSNATTTTDTTTTPAAKAKKTRALPDKEMELLTVGKNVEPNYLVAEFELPFCTRQMYPGLLSNYEGSLTQKLTAKAKRSPSSQVKSDKEKLMDVVIEFVKYYINQEFGKKAGIAYYTEFGMVKDHGAYKLPKDPQSKLKGIEMLITALTKYGFENEPYGVPYWTQTRDEYTPLIADDTTNVTTESKHVGDKNIYKADLKKALNSIILAIKAHYPDNYKNVLRAWGFLKERY